MSRKSRHRKKSKSSIKSSMSDSLMSDSFEEDVFSLDEPKFDVKVSQVMGRYMVSTKTLKPGEIILSEGPLVVGPCTGCKVQCLGCYKNLEQVDNFTKCNGCKWPLCSQTCSGLHQQYGHTQIECSILKECKSTTKMNYDDFSSLRVFYHIIAPLRCLILKTTNSDAYDKIMNMEHHSEIRKNIPDVWGGNQVNVVDRIIKDWGLTEFTEDEVHKVCGILEVNCFEIGQQGVNIRGLYPTAFLMSHDCVPNTNHTDEENCYKLTVRASTEIMEGHPITLSYAYTLQGTLRRREQLLDNKFFECQCRRCSDPTELETYTSALICPKCKVDYVLSINPLDSESAWKCRNTKGKCPGYSLTARSMRLLIDRITDEVERIDCNDIKSMEMFLQKYRNVLHPTHYLCLGIKLSLSQLYGKIDGYLIYQLDEILLNRKRDICKEILKIFDVIEPGYTRIRGVTLYELHAPLMILLTREFEGESKSNSELKTKLREVVVCLNEARIILSSEPETSPEGVMGKAAREALLQIKDWEKIIGRI